MMSVVPAEIQQKSVIHILMEHILRRDTGGTGLPVPAAVYLIQSAYLEVHQLITHSLETKHRF